jgi:hypothetical protein
VPPIRQAKPRASKKGLILIFRHLLPARHPGRAKTRPARPRAIWRGTLALLGIGLAGALGVGGCGGDDSSEPTPVPQPTAAQLAASGLSKIPVAPDSKRVDLTAPPFSNPTEVTNPLFPISDLHSAVLNGRIDGKPFHTETTLLPYTRAMGWPPGQQTETLVSQYAAFLDGRIQEVALDYYAQADDGSVWYFGEDVADYNPQGLIAFTTDSWLAGKDGPPAMIMPGDPKLGDAFRTENIPGVVFEEVTVKTLDKTVKGPPGPVQGAMVGQELHDDGMKSNKTFAPGYGEFLTRDTDGVEAMALAVPTDALHGPPPPELKALSRGANRAFDAVQSSNWKPATASLRTATAAWRDYQRANQVPPRLKPPMNRAITALDSAMGARNPERAGTAAIDVAQAALDLELRYRPPTEIDLARFEQWNRQLIVDARAGNLGGARGDLVTMEWTRDRFADAIKGVDRTRIDTALLKLSEGVADNDLAAVRPEAASLGDTLAGLTTAN